MHYPVCRQCNNPCGNLPDGDDKMTTCDECKSLWSQEEKEELFANVFGGQTRVPEG